jgi:chloramphenicol O-acetyltransferase type A
VKQKLALENWPRKDHFKFFSQFEEPFFGVCVEVDCSKAYQKAKQKQQSFFLTYLHASLMAVNAIESFKYRISDDEVWIYNQVNASPTINRPDGTFGFAYMDYYEEFEKFYTSAEAEILRVQNSSGLIPAGSGQNVIHYSSLPWLNFTAISHARSFSFKDSCPKISFGKLSDSKQMPVSIHVHHALMDGFHVGQFVEAFQQILNVE